MRRPCRVLSEFCLGILSNFQALRTMRHTPSIWPDAAVYCAISSPQSVENFVSVAKSHTSVSEFSNVQTLRTQRRLRTLEQGTGSAVPLTQQSQDSRVSERWHFSRAAD